MRELQERVILVTGATDGLGRAVAGALAQRGATVLLHGRSSERLADTEAQLRSDASDAKLRTYRADLARLADVRTLAAEVKRREARLDVLVNNAGIGTTLPGDGERQESPDGYELRFAVNYLAGYLLTRLCLPLLTRSAPARIVNVSSAGQTPIDFDDVMLERDYSPTRAYCQSKLAQVMLTLDLAAELREQGVSANCLHPATYMPTKMVLHARAGAASTVREGTEATLRLIADPELGEVTGAYFDGQRPARAHPQAYDGEARRALAELSEQLTQNAGVPA